VLGAQLDLGGLANDPSMLALAGTLVALNVVIHVFAAVVVRRPVAGGLVAGAQLGMPAAIATLGLADGVLSRTVATAIIASALVSLVICTLGIERLAAPRALTPDRVV
jgi:hypothetical protein